MGIFNFFRKKKTASNGASSSAKESRKENASAFWASPYVMPHRKFHIKDVFTCGMGLYAKGVESESGQEIILEFFDLEGEVRGHVSGNYVLVATPDIVAKMKAENRAAANEKPLPIRKNDMRTLADMENSLGYKLASDKPVFQALFFTVGVETY
jgi:hypothetical protein